MMLRFFHSRSRRLTLANGHLSANWQIERGTFYAHTLQSGTHTLALAPPFTLHCADAAPITCEHCILLTVQKRRHTLTITWQHAATGLHITWQASLTPDQPFLQQQLTLISTKGAVAITRITLLQLALPDARLSGTLSGCPILSPHWFAAFAHPLAQHEIADGTVSASLDRYHPLKYQQSVTYRSVIGATSLGQQRRDIAQYLAATRPRAYAPMLHYNCWYDLSFSNVRYDEAGLLDRITTLGRELTERRGVALPSFLLDDGWDDPSRLWHWHEGFAHGLHPVQKALATYGMKAGMWLSPWGGYGEEKTARLATGAAMGMEQDAQGFMLSGRQYYALFEKRCLQLLQHYGINQFKLDGMGSTARHHENSVFDSDFDAAIALIAALRECSPDLFINLTVGTFSSPFWLHHADSIWRGGADHGFAGPGSQRQQWITFRDGETYRHVVQQCAVFPLSSLMLHGIIFAQHCPPLAHDDGHDFACEVQSFFASGTQCQELYLSPHLLHAHHWDVLAKGAAFSTRFAHLLHDSHWIGGDPYLGEIYGWAAYHAGEGLITLRNPADHPQSFTLDLAAQLELQANHPVPTHARDGWNDSVATPIAPQHTITLAPWQVKTWYLINA